MGEFDPADFCEARRVQRSFRPPPLGQFLRKNALLLGPLIFAQLLLVCAQVFVALALGAQQRSSSVLLLLAGMVVLVFLMLAAGLGWIYLAGRNASITLEADRLVECDPLGRRRVFLYRQICSVGYARRGLMIGYHPYVPGLGLDEQRIRRATLVPVENLVQLSDELQARKRAAGEVWFPLSTISLSAVLYRLGGLALALVLLTVVTRWSNAAPVRLGMGALLLLALVGWGVRSFFFRDPGWPVDQD